MIRTDDVIDRRDVALYMDVKCTACGKLMALSSAFQWRNEYLCEQHSPSLETLIRLAETAQ